MYILWIEGRKVFKSEFMKPAIDYLNIIAQGDQIEVATIVRVDD